MQTASSTCTVLIKSRGFAAVCVKVEIFVVDFLVLSIGADRLDGGVELFTQRVLALANGNANTVAKVLLDRGYRAGNFAAGAVVSLQPLLKDNDIVVHRVQAAARNVELVLIGGRIKLDITVGIGR